MPDTQTLIPAQELAATNTANFPNESGEYRKARNALLVSAIIFLHNVGTSTVRPTHTTNGVWSRLNPTNANREILQIARPRIVCLGARVALRLLRPGCVCRVRTGMLILL